MDDSDILFVDDTFLFDKDNLMKQFLCCTSLKTMDIFNSDRNVGLDLYTQKEILDKTINNDLIKKYPVKRSYQRAFLKLLMNKIEEEGSEIHDDLYIAYCNLISNPISELIHHRHFLIGDISDCISIQESTNIISDATTGLCCWQGAIELSKWCIENKSAFHDKVVLELGCGVGLTGVCIIKNCSPNQYIFTDFHKSVLEMVCENVKLNLLNMEQTVEVKQLSESNRLKFQTKYNNTDVQVVKLNWEDINKYLDEYWTVPDIIIGADILYDTYSFNALALGLKAFLSFNGRYAVIAAAIRNVDTFSKFLHFLKSHGLSYEECSTPTQTVLLQEIHIPVKIIKICRKT